MKILHRALEKSLEEFAVKHAALSEDRLAEAIGKAIKEGLPSATKILSNDLRAKAPEMLREHRELEAGFRTRNFERWREGLDLLQMLIVIAEEAGSDLNREFRPQAVRENNLVFETVCSLHSRAVLVAREVLCLLEGGFADGPLLDGEACTNWLWCPASYPSGRTTNWRRGICWPGKPRGTD